MAVSIRVMCVFVVFLMIAWISGCANKSSNNICRSFDHTTVNRSRSTSKFLWRKDIVRDQNTSLQFLNKYPFTNSNRYTYNHISKGSYSFCCYKVQPGDTLFYIAWITGNDYRVLAKNNNISINDILKVGQILKVGNNSRNELWNKKISKNSLTNQGLKRDIQTSPSLNISVLNRPVKDAVHSNVSFNKSCTLDQHSIDFRSASNYNTQKISYKSDAIIPSNRDKIVSDVSSNFGVKSSIFWSWPAVGKVVNTFSSSEGGNKGIDISGIIGQPVFSARSGKVVYAGNALFGYGNLIIIKHDNDFLSTYAHNDKILVVEQQNVTVGQKIATMGNSGSDTVKLHFEIRYKGQSVDPLFYLPNKNDSSNKK